MEHFVADVITKQLAQFLVLSPDELHLHLLSGEVRLQNVRLNTNTINKDYATASPLLVKKGIVGLLRVQFKPLRVDAINVLVEDIELEVEPRPPDSDWWSKQAAAAPVTLDRSQQLALLDPEAAAIEEFAKDGAGPSRLQKIAVGFLERLTAAVLGALRVEVRNVRVSVVVGFRGEGTDVRAKGSEIACHRQNQSGKEEERGGYVENIRNGMPSEVQSGEQSGPNDGGGRRDARPVADGLEKAEDAVREGNEDNNAEGRNSVIESAEPHTAIPVAPGGRSPPGGQEYVALEVALESFILFEGRHGQNGGSGGGLLGAAWTAVFGSGGADKGSVSKHTQLGGLAIRLETSEGRGEGEAEMSDNSKGLSRAKPGESEQTIDSDTETTVVSLGGLSSPESSIKSGEGLASGEEKGATPLRVASVSRRSILLPNEIDTVLRINKLGLDRVQVDARTMAMELDVQDLAALAHLAAALSPPAKVSAGQSSLEGSEGTREAATNRGSTEGKPGEAEGKSHGKGRSEQTPAQDSEGGSKEGRSEEGEGGLSEAALRWQKAFRLIREQSHSTRLHGVLEAGAARRRYVALYAEWLRAIGWGEDAPAQLARQQAEKRQPREVQRLKARLHDSLQTTEGSLPIEAIVVARKIARAQIQGQNGEDAKGAFLSLSRGASGVQKEGEDWWFWETKYYKSAKAIAKVLYAVLWGLLNTLWTIVVSPYNGFVSATHVMQARPEADPWAVDDDVTPAEITSAKGDEQAPAGAPAQLALTASFHIGAGSVTFSSSRMTSAPRQQEGEAPEGQAVRLTWSRLSLSATQSGGEGGGAVYLARVTLGSVDCNCISVLSYSTAIQLGRADSLSEPPRLESTPSGGFLRSIFGLERQRSEGVEVDEVTERDATFDDKPRLVEGSGGNTPLFVSGFAPEWKTGHPKASSKLLGMGAFCNRGLGRARRAPAGSVGGGLSLKSRLLGTNDPGSRSLFTQPSLPSDAHEASGSQTAPVESTSHARKPSFLSQFFNRPFSHLARAPSLARLPSFSSQTSSLATKQGPSREEQAAAERRRERRERWRARLAANRPFAVAAVEVNTSGFMNPGDDEAAAVTCGASVGRLSLFVGLDVLDRVGPILSELRDLAASLDLLSTPSGATAIDKSKPDRGTEPGQSGKDTRGVPEVQRPNSPSDVLTSSIASVFTLLGPSICAAAPSIRLDVSAVVDLPRLILTGGAPDAPSASESIIADAGQLALSLWPVSPALHQQERRRRASQVSASGRTPPGQGLRAPPPEKKDDAINPSGGLWEISALELEAWDRHPSLPRDVVGGRYSQRFRIWNSARLTLSAASAAVADVSMSKLARREGGMEDFGATWLVEPAGVEVSASLLKEVGTSLFGGGTAASVVLGLRLAELAVDPLPDAVARAVGVASQLMRGVEKLVAELSPKTGALTQEAPSPGVGDVLGEGLKYTADTAAEVVVEQVPIPSLAKANQVELFSLAAYVHAAKLKANLSEGGKQEAERGSEGGLGRGKGSGDVRREGEEKTGEAGPQSPSGKSRAHGRWAHATRTITNLRRQAAENRGQRDPRPELAQTQARQRLEGVPAHVALEGAWLSVHLSGKDCQADVAGGLGAVRMEVGAKAQDEGWGVTALTDGKPGFGGERSQLTLGRCGFEASLGEVLRRGVRELEGEDTSTLFDDNSENRGLLTDQEISPPANLISAALQVGSLTFLESGEAGLTVTRHVKQAMTGPESLTLAVEIAEGLQAVSLHSTGGLFLVDSGALARAYAFLTDFATALSVSVSAGLSEGGGTPERPQRGDSASGKGATSSNSRSVTSDGQQPGADPFEASADMSRAGVKRSLEEGPETVINRSRSRGTSLSQSGKTVRWADVETAGEEQPYGESGGEVEEIGPESKSAAFSERKQGKERTESGGGLGNGTLEAPSAGGTSGVAGLDIKVTVSVKGVTTGLLRSIAVDLAPAGAVLMELDTTASVTTENGDLSARLDLSRVALLGVIPPPQEVGTRVSGESSSAALFKEAEHESAKTSSREHFGATVTRGFREQGRPSEDELSPALRGGRLILECLRLGAKVRSVPSEKSDGVSDDSFSWGGTRSGGLLPPPRAETSVLNPKALETLDANESKHLDRLIEAVRAQSGAWEGECHVSGADVAVTTSELQLLISIATPLYTALYATGTTAAVDKKMRKEVGLAVAGKDAEELALQDLVDIPDGAIVAIKDEQEQLFVSVEPLPSNPEHFRVVGKRHYTLADTVTGEGRALFKVKRHSKRGSGNKDQAWFSLLSLYARHPTSGEPFRLHFSPKTNQAGISTTNDGSWELFRLQAVEGSQYGTSGDAFDGAEGEGGSARKTRPRIHMVNKKAGKGLAFLEGAPVFTSKLGNPVKLKVLTVPLTEGLDVEAGSNTGAGVVQGQRDVIPTESTRQPIETPLELPLQHVENVAVALTSVPHVKVSVAGGLKATILHEAAGGAHILPLLRLSADDIGAIVTSGTRKSRAYAELVTSAEYFESQRSQWGPMVTNLALDVSYRGRSGDSADRPPDRPQKPLPFPFPKVPTNVFLFIRDRVDFELNQVAMDTLLFLVGALGLAGPYVVKYSPTQANQCRVENKTGVDLMCRFNDEEGEAARSDGVVRSFEGESFLIRHIASRRDPRPALASSGLVLQLRDAPHGLSSAPFGFPFTESDARLVNLKLTGRNDRNRRGEPVGEAQVVIDMSTQSQVGLVVNASPLLLVRNASGVSLDVFSRSQDQGPDPGRDDFFTLANNRAADDLASAFQRAADGTSKGLSASDAFLCIRPTGAVGPSGWSDDIIRAPQTALPAWADQLVMGARSVMSEILGHRFDLAVATVSCKVGPGGSPAAPIGGGAVPNGTDDVSGEDDDVSGREADVSGGGGMHFLVKTLLRKVPRRDTGAVNNWADQREIVVLPTMRVRNTLPEDVAVRLHQSHDEADAWLTSLAGRAKGDRGGGLAELSGGALEEGEREDVDREESGASNGETGKDGDGTVVKPGADAEGVVPRDGGNEGSLQKAAHMNGATDANIDPGGLSDAVDSVTSKPVDSETFTGNEKQNESESGAPTKATGSVSKVKPISKAPTKKFTLSQTASFFRRAAPRNPLEGVDGSVVPGRGQEICLHGNPANAFLSVYHPELGASLEPVSLAESGLVDLTAARESLSIAGWGSSGNKSETDLEVRFGKGDNDKKGLVVVRVARDADGVLKLTLHVRYSFQNDSGAVLECVPCPQPKKKGHFGRHKGPPDAPDWPPRDHPDAASTAQIRPGTLAAWMCGSETLLVREPPRSGSSPPKATFLDIKALAGALEIDLVGEREDGKRRHLQLGLAIVTPTLGTAASAMDLTRIIRLRPRYIVLNSGSKPILVAQDGFERDPQFVRKLAPGERVAMHAQELVTDENNEDGDRRKGHSEHNGPVESPGQLHLRVRPEGSPHEWSGRLCAAALGTFYLKSRPGLQLGDPPAGDRAPLLWLAEVADDSPSLVVSIRPQTTASVPYKIENNMQQGIISFCQKGMSEMELLEPGQSVEFVWDDLAQERRLVVVVVGTQLREEVRLDKLRGWTAMRARGAARSSTFFSRFHDKVATAALKAMAGDAAEGDVSYQVSADGPTRVLRVSDQTEETSAPKEDDVATMEARVSLSSLGFTLLENVRQRRERDRARLQVAQTVNEESYSPLLYLRVIGVEVDYVSGEESVSAEVKLRRADIDVRWEGARKPVLLRPYAGFDDEKGDTLMHLAVIGSTKTTSPLHLTYFSFLLQAIEVNVDEDTLVKLVAFARTSLAPPVTKAPSTLVYFERFEVHPIKIVGSFLPGSADTEGDSAQEALRGMLHSVVRLPAVKNQKVELNGVLLTHALLTYSQLATKCAIHYYWYAMRAISLARGAEFLPPSFVSLFDDSASASLDVFFDPKAGAIDKTVGMFNLLRKEVKKRGGWSPLTSWGAGTRILGEQAAGWGVNVARVLLTEVSDSLLKGAETQGMDGLWRGFQRGVMHAAMADPMTVLQAALKGSGTHKIQLDKSLGTDEAYIEGYLQAMLDRTFRQDYLRVKLSNDQVILKNLPPNSRLTSEIIEETRNFLIGEGLIEGDSHAAVARSRRFRGEDNSLLPIARALAEELVVVIIVHKLHVRACQLLHLRTSEKEKPLPMEKPLPLPEEHKPKKEGGANIRSIVRKGAFHLALSSALAWVDGRLCRRIPNPFMRKIVSAFILSFVTERRL